MTSWNLGEWFMGLAVNFEEKFFTDSRIFTGDPTPVMLLHLDMSAYSF